MSARDAVGRPLAIGDVVGGTTSSRYQATVTGKITAIGKSGLTLQVLTSSREGSFGPSAGDSLRITQDRVFLIDSRRDCLPDPLADLLDRLARHFREKFGAKHQATSELLRLKKEKW